MAYFDFAPDGSLCVSRAFLEPIVQHFNYDYFANLTVTADLKQPAGARVVSIVYQGSELPENRELTLCLNNYRASGAGGYEAYKACPLLAEQPTEISELIMQYVKRERKITVDKTQWLHLIHA